MKLPSGEDHTDDKSTLVQVMAWCHQAPSHYLNQCWPTSMIPYDITRLQWVWVYFPSLNIDIYWFHQLFFRQELDPHIYCVASDWMCSKYGHYWQAHEVILKEWYMYSMIFIMFINWKFSLSYLFYEAVDSVYTCNICMYLVWIILACIDMTISPCFHELTQYYLGPLLLTWINFNLSMDK